MLFHFALQNGNEVERKLYDERFGFESNVQEGLDSIMSDSKTTFLWESDTVEYQVENPCSIQLMKLYPRKSVFYTKPNHPYFSILQY